LIFEYINIETKVLLLQAWVTLYDLVHLFRPFGLLIPKGFSKLFGFQIS